VTVLAVFLCVVAWATGVPLPTVDELMALPSTADRVAALTAVLQSGTVDGETLSKAASAIQVLEKLDAAGRSDPAVVSGFLEAALSDEPERRTDAVDVAATGLPPGPRPPPVGRMGGVVGSAPEAAPLADLTAYQSRRLYTGTLEHMTVSTYGNTFSVNSMQNWTVYQNSRAVRPREFATMVGDQATLDELARKRTTVAAVSVVSSLVGIGTLVGGIAMIGDENVENDLAGMLVAGIGGGVGLSIGIALPWGVSVRRQWVASVYESDEAQRWIDRYNGALREELELSEDDVRDIEIGE
jgi:hypothetical protein